MTDHTDLIERLRDYSGTFDHACINESADALEAAQAEIEAQQHRIQALWMERDAALARIAELTKQEPVAWADDAAMRGSVGNVCSDAAKRYWAKSDWVDRKSVELHKHPLYAAAGASPVQPSQAGEHCLWARNGHQPCQHTQPAQHTQLIQQALGAAIPRRSKFNLGPAMTPWYPPATKPARDGLYLRDYSDTQEGGWHFDYWLTNGGNVGYWYVNEPKGQWNDAWYKDLPWLGLTRGEYLEGTI